MMHVLSILVVCITSSTLAATIPVTSVSTSKATGSHLSPPTLALHDVNLTTTQYTTPWPEAPWTYSFPHSPHYLFFEHISPEDPGLEGQQAFLHDCDEIIRWLWENYKADQIVEHAYVQRSNFNGKKEGSVTMAFVPVTAALGGTIDRELALDSMRALEAVVWRYGGRGLECEIWAAGSKLKGRISVSIKMSEAKTGVVPGTNLNADTVPGASSM